MAHVPHGARKGICGEGIWLFPVWVLFILHGICSLCLSRSIRRSDFLFVLRSPWWLCENYMYKRILEIFDEMDDDLAGQDPFGPLKAAALDGVQADAVGAAAAETDLGVAGDEEMLHGVSSRRGPLWIGATQVSTVKCG